jgi:hypothetical protein
VLCLTEALLAYDGIEGMMGLKASELYNSHHMMKVEATTRVKVCGRGPAGKIQVMPSWK